MKPSWYPILRKLVLVALQNSPAGLSEYDLIDKLRRQGQDGLIPDSLAESLDLFRTHFMIFYTLYRLRDELWSSAQAYLDIGPLNISLLDYRVGESSLMKVDALREYYLDLEQLEQTSSEEVDNMLASFWSRMTCDDFRKEALEELGLVDPVGEAAIKKRYRELAMKHHPDRGGDKEKLQSINLAMANLAGKAI